MTDMKLDTEPSGSPLEAALERIGDRWSLLIVDALQDGPQRFSDLQSRLPAIAPNILAGRLRRLEKSGIVIGETYSARPPRIAYALTADGRALSGALRLLADWGTRHSPDGQVLRHAPCGTPMEAHWYCPTCDRTVREAESLEPDRL
jgi:DNA-binding HxlR family transcriptional regulator